MLGVVLSYFPWEQNRGNTTRDGTGRGGQSLYSPASHFHINILHNTTGVTSRRGKVNTAVDAYLVLLVLNIDIA